MGQRQKDSGCHIETDKETERESLKLFESVRFTAMAQNQQHGGQVDAENGPPFVLDFLLSR